MQKTFKEHYDFLMKNQDYWLGKLSVAMEVASMFGKDHERYEDICNAVYNMYIHTYSISVYQLTCALEDGMSNYDISLDNVLKEGSEDYKNVVEMAIQCDY